MIGKRLIVTGAMLAFSALAAACGGTAQPAWTRFIHTTPFSCAFDQNKYEQQKVNRKYHEIGGSVDIAKRMVNLSAGVTVDITPLELQAWFGNDKLSPFVQVSADLGDILVSCDSVSESKNYFVVSASRTAIVFKKDSPSPSGLDIVGILPTFLPTFGGRNVLLIESYRGLDLLITESVVENNAQVVSSRLYGEDSKEGKNELAMLDATARRMGFKDYKEAYYYDPDRKPMPDLKQPFDLSITGPTTNPNITITPRGETPFVQSEIPRQRFTYITKIIGSVLNDKKPVPYDPKTPFAELRREGGGTKLVINREVSILKPDLSRVLLLFPDTTLDSMVLTEEGGKKLLELKSGIEIIEGKYQGQYSANGKVPLDNFMDKAVSAVVPLLNSGNCSATGFNNIVIRCP